MEARVACVGSCNIDLISYVPRMAKVGETLHGTEFKKGFGGKGANQAVAAGKLGAAVTFVGKVGKDTFGDETLQNFKNLGMNTDHLHMTDKASSGVAPIFVDAQGRNSIVIVAGANMLLTPQEVEAAREDIKRCKVLLCQLEVAPDATLAAMKLAREEGVTTILNPAPAVENLDKKFFELADYVVPNETEAEILTGRKVDTVDDAKQAARAILDMGSKNVVLTLGEKGSYLINEAGELHIPCKKVDAVDTSGAGDCFLGSFSYFLAREVPIQAALEKAGHIASVSVTGHGTQTSYKSRSELPADLFE